MKFALRPFQKEALAALSSNNGDILCIAPTGSGKSLIYERATQKPGRRTLLISPLVALARQQKTKLQKLGIPTYLNARGPGRELGIPDPESSEAWILSPESLRYPFVLSRLRAWRPTLLVVDECHCLWDWGESFRPSFELIPTLLESVSIRQSLWLTATLPYEARQQLRDKIAPLKRPPLTEIGTFGLPEALHLFIQRVPWKDRVHHLMKTIQSKNTAGLVFVNSRATSERLVRLIRSSGKKVVAYHAGLSKEERLNIEASISNRVPDVVVATSAFGMGMHFPHLTYVVLWQSPPSLLSLVQTIGRVGRRLNQKAEAHVFWDYEDLRLLEWTLQQSKRRLSALLELLQFFETERCRSSQLAWYFDRKRSNDSCLKCDICLL